MRDEIDAILQSYDVSDGALRCHGYRDHMRDYALVIANDLGGPATGTHAYIFQYCVETQIVSILTKDGWKLSLDDKLLGSPFGMVTSGFHWGIRQAEVLDWRRLRSSERAAKWSSELDLPLSEVVIETNAFRICLIFKDIAVERLSGDMDDRFRFVDPLRLPLV